jgi:predicted DNA-binding transcriptional regulator YafY
MLKDSGFDPSSPTSLQGDGKQAVAQRELQALILEARSSVVAPSKRGAAVIKAEHLTHIPGSKLANQANEAADRPPEVNETDARAALDTAIATGCNVLMVYATRSGEKVDYFVTPERLAFKGDSVVLVALDLNENARRSYLMEQIERIQLMPKTEDS